MADPHDNSHNGMESKKDEENQQNVSVTSELDVNDGESKHLANENEEEEDELVSFKDIFADEEISRQRARALYGAQDSSVCTYPEGYKPRQAVFSCLTCADKPEMNEAGICYGCSIHCHDDHDIVELFTKRRFRCDCGNSKFKRKCTLFEEKSPLNEENIYNHNFAGLFCLCKKPYPCEINEALYQCAVCEDWFHLSHLDEKCAKKAEEWEKSEQDDPTLICKECSSRLPFLSRLCEGDDTIGDVVCVSTVPEVKEGPFLLVPDFRERLCRCQNCLDLYARSDCEFLIDAEDDVDAFEEENFEKTKDDQEPDDNAIVNQLVETAGRDGAIRVLRGFNELKRSLVDFINEKAEEDVVITAEHVKSFFDKLKRRRIEEQSSDDE